MKTYNGIANSVNIALSEFYKQEVVGGYNNGGWPVIRPANNPTAVVDGGMDKNVPSLVLAVLRAQSNLIAALEELKDP